MMINLFAVVVYQFSPLLATDVGLIHFYHSLIIILYCLTLPLLKENNSKCQLIDLLNSMLQICSIVNRPFLIAIIYPKAFSFQLFPILAMISNHCVVLVLFR